MEIDKVALLFVEDRKVLAAVSRGKDAFYFPGGKREGNETDKQTLIREIREELSVDLIPESIRYYGTFRAQAYGKPEGVAVKMTCYKGKFTGTPKPSSEIEYIMWVSSDAENATSVGRLILGDLKNKSLID